jgi:flagellar motility protein MotE (MotC chaperone)
MKVRSLPILLILLTLSLLAKVINLSAQIYKQNTDDKLIKVNSFFIEEAEASAHGSAKKEDKKQSSGHGSAHGEKKDSHGSEHGEKTNTDKKDDAKAQAEQVKPTPDGQSYVTLECNPELSKYSPDQIKLLQNLAQRRKEIEQKFDELGLKQKLLQATELQVNAKLTELKQLKSEVEDLLAQYNTKENEKLMSLVKIYESMKPQDAANIFNALDMHVLLQVIGNMKEAKVAPILSKMDPVRAREVSIEFANQKKIPDKIAG